MADAGIEFRLQDLQSRIEALEQYNQNFEVVPPLHRDTSSTQGTTISLDETGLGIPVISTSSLTTNKRVFSTPGNFTYTVPSEFLWIKFEAIGGGGSSGSAAAPNNPIDPQTSLTVAGAGGPGGYFRCIIGNGDITVPNFNLTVGQGGAVSSHAPPWVGNGGTASSISSASVNAHGQFEIALTANGGGGGGFSDGFDNNIQISSGPPVLYYVAEQVACGPLGIATNQSVVGDVFLYVNVDIFDIIASTPRISVSGIYDNPTFFGLSGSGGSTGIYNPFAQGYGVGGLGVATFSVPFTSYGGAPGGNGAVIITEYVLA